MEILKILYLGVARERKELNSKAEQFTISLFLKDIVKFMS